MKEETSKYINTNIQVIPFGVDTNKFSFTEKDLSKNEITIGIIKSLEKKYGIDLLIKAFAEAQKKTDKKLKLLIVGDGSKKLEYKKLCGELGVSDSVEFTGKIAHNEILNFHRRIDVFVSLSTLDSESFGVSLVEAMACGTPVIASDVAGFKEVVGNSENGTLVPKNSYHEAADAILNYIQNPAIATQKAKNARERIVREYDWNKNVGQMISIYHKVLS